MESAENRPRHNPHVPRKILVGGRGGWQSGRCVWQARTETRGGAAAIVGAMLAALDFAVLTPKVKIEVQGPAAASLTVAW